MAVRNVFQRASGQYRISGVVAHVLESKQSIRQISAEEAVNTYLKRIEAVNPKLNAIVQLTAQTALQQAKEADTAWAKGELTGPLHGVPFTAKDNIETAGVVCTAGTTGRAAFIPTKDRTINICLGVTSPSGRGRPLRAG